jgi:outer membrane protein assembly factor BamB
MSLDLPDAPPDDEKYDPIIGKTIDGCVVQRKLGAGGMGVVYLAVHDTLKQEFVLKILNPALTGADDTVDRFFREAQACAQLNHPGIVAIQNVGQEGEYYFIRMEYVEGDTLEDQIADAGQLDWVVATKWCIQVAEALSHAHQKGMIHRDIKPENVMLMPNGQIKVMDFGLAKHVHSSAKVSVTGQIVGTPFFMSPEQAGGKPTDARSDIYSLGVTLYYLATGVKPFNGKNLQEIFLKHFFYAPESPKIYNDALPESLCEVVKRCLKKKKKERYQSAKALMQDLQAVVDDPGAELGSGASPTAAAAAAAADSDLGDRTVVSGGGGGEEPADVTVRVDSEPADRTVVVDTEDPGGATVRVDAGGEDDGGGATVRVKSDKPVDRGGVGTVSFGSHKDVDSSTVRLTEDDDEEDAHAGLDLPQAVMQELGIETPQEQEDRERATAGPKRDMKKIAIAAAAAILIPLTLVFLFRFMAQSNYSTLKAQYDTVMREDSENKQAMRTLADNLTEFAATTMLSPGLAEDARGLSKKLQDHVVTLEQAAADETTRKREEEERLQALKDEKDRREALLREARASFSELTDLRESAEGAEQANDNATAYTSWTSYVERGKIFLSEYSANKETYEELAKMLAQIRYPVFVNSDPPGAEILVGGRTQDKQTPARLEVVPGVELKIAVRREGFLDQDKTRRIDGVTHFEFSLLRQELREAMSFGRLKIPFGGGREEEDLLPAHALVVVEGAAQRSEAFVYFVGHGGNLRGYSLKDRGRLRWGLDAKSHGIGAYGDPTPSLCVVPDKAILAASMRGYLSAHSPQSGAPIWPNSIRLDAPATSPPVYKRVFNLIAVGTASGRVYFVSDVGEVKGSFPTENPVVAPPYFWGNRICLIGSTDNRLYSVDWRQTIPKELHRIDLGADVIAGPVPIGPRLLVGTSAGQVHLVSVDRAGKLTHEKTVGGSTDSPVSGIRVVGDKFFFTSGRQLFAASSDGTPLWKEPFNAPKTLTAPLVPFEGDLVYAGCEDGTLYAVDKQTGEVRWPFSVPEATPIRFPPFVVGRELFVVAGSRIHVLAAD